MQAEQFGGTVPSGQHAAFQAAARYTTVVNQMMDEVLSIVR